jgi:Ca-activated chloride channel family protein
VLEKESISAKVSGYIARVTVKQRFRNQNRTKVDADYTFPLSDTAAVDSMTMQIGKRTINGTISEREEARQIYENARAYGYTASLLEQERTNVFTQSVANIEPGKPVDITINYTEMVPYQHGHFNLVFPTKVGPRFMPAGMNAEASRVSTSGNQSASTPDDLTVNVALDEGNLPLIGITSPLQQVAVDKLDNSRANLFWRGGHNQEGQDVVVNWQVATNELQTGYLTHKEGNDGFVTAMIMPPKKVATNAVAPREMVFIMDCSGSQSGAPIEKAKETLHFIVDHMNPEDTFQIIAFSNTVRKFGDKPLPVSYSMKLQAHAFINGLYANGGTIMMPAIEAACNTPADEHRLRIVTLMTDGFIGNDYDIISTVKKLRGNSRWFPFGTGNNVNRTLIDGIAREGGGEPEYVLLTASGEQVAKSFYDRIASPVLTNVKLSGEGIDLTDVYPTKLSDVWEERPLYFQARYKNGGKGNLLLTGFYQGKPYTQRVPVVLPTQNAKNDSIAQIWARSRIDELMSQDWEAMQFGRGSAKPEVVGEIIQTSLAYHVMSQFTSFVAVDSAMAALQDDDDQSTAKSQDKTADECQKTDESKGKDACATNLSAKPEQPKLSQRTLPALNQTYEMLSPKNVVCALGAAAVIGAARGGVRVPNFAGVLIATGIGVATVFGFARGALQSTLSQSFSTTVSQLNCLNSYAASSGSGGYGYASYASSPVVAQLPTSVAGTGSYAVSMPAYGQSTGIRIPAHQHAPARHHKHKSTQAAGAAQQQAAAQQAQQSPPPPYDPYNLQFSNPFGGTITLDLQAGAFLLQWILFLTALFLLPLTAKARANPRVRSRLLYACAFVFVSLNVQSTFLWMIQCAHSANLI